MIRFNSSERRDIVDKSQRCLWTTEGLVGFEYLIGKRCLSEKCIRDFCLGYIPRNVCHQLAGRIIFPFYDASKNLICVSSRLVDGDPDVLPVYWHESYEKDFYLYGIHIAKSSMMKWSFAIIVEGQIDAIRLYDSGLTNTVALCGTKFSDIQLALINRYCEEIVVILDKDENMAGQKAAEKIRTKIGYAGVKSDNFFLEDYSRKIITLSFDENLDPDEFIMKHGVSKIKSMIKMKILELRNRGC